jgi:hypothetical protein
MGKNAVSVLSLGKHQAGTGADTIALQKAVGGNTKIICNA